MWRKRKARLNGMVRLVWAGWQELFRRYWCLSVGLVWRSVWIWFWRHWFNMAKILSKFGEQQLVMVNYACGFNQSETGKYFEWIIKLFTVFSAFITYLGPTGIMKWQNLTIYSIYGIYNLFRFDRYNKVINITICSVYSIYNLFRSNGYDKVINITIYSIYTIYNLFRSDRYLRNRPVSMGYLQVNALSEWIIGIYLHEFTNENEKFRRPRAVLKISSSLLVNECS